MTAKTKQGREAPPTLFTIRGGQAALLDALNRVLPAAARRSTLPVLQCVRIGAEGGRVAFTATDLDQRITAFADIEFAGTGVAVVPLKRLQAIVASLTTGTTVEVELVGINLRVRCGRSRFEIPGFAADEFPNDIASRSGNAFSATIEAPALVAAIRKVTPVLDRNEASNPKKRGAYLDPTKQGLVLVGTNGHQFSRVLIGERGDFTAECIIPLAALEALQKLFAAEASVTVSGDSDSALFAGTRSTLRCRLIEGPYFPYQAVLDTNIRATVIVNSAALEAAVRRVRLASNEHARVDLIWGPDVVQLTARTEDLGQAEDFVECRVTDGEPPRIAFSADYLLDALAIAGADEHGDVALQFCGAERIAYMRRADALASLNVAGLMPMRVIGGVHDYGTPSTTQEEAEEVAAS